MPRKIFCYSDLRQIRFCVCRQVETCYIFSSGSSWSSPCSWSALLEASLHSRTSSSSSSFSEKSNLFSCEESEVFSGSSYAAPPESSLDSLRFSASLCCPPSSPSGGNNRQLDDNLRNLLFSISTLEARLEISVALRLSVRLSRSRDYLCFLSQLIFNIVHYTVNISILLLSFDSSTCALN